MSFASNRFIKWWFSLHLHIQLALASAVLLALTISVATWFNIQSQKEELLEKTNYEALSLANNLSIVGSYLLITYKLDELESLLVQSASFPSITMLRVASVDGQTLAHVRKLESGEIITVFNLVPITVPDAKNHEPISQIDWQANRLTIWQPIKTSSLIGWIKMEVSLKDVAKIQQQTIRDNIIGAIVAITFDILILLAILYIPARSLRKVVNFASLMTDKPGKQMDFIGGSYEIDNMIAALNSASLKQARQQDEIQQQANNLIKLNETLEQRVKNRTEALSESNTSLNLFKNAVEQNPNVTFITDNNGTIEYVNPAFTTVTGYSAEEVIGKTPSLLKSSEMPDHFYQDLWATLLSGKTWSGLMRNRKSNGDLYWVQAQISPIYSSHGEMTHFLSIQEDITEQRQMEEQLRRSQKMDALGKLTGGIAHDYNNMLGVILGYSKILEGALSGNPKLAQYRDEAKLLDCAEKIHHAGERGAQLTQKLLSFSRYKSSDAKLLDVNKLLLEQQLMLEKTLTASIKLVLNLADNLWPVCLDSGDLENAILNISINAMHAMEAGGQLTIMTMNEHISEIDSRILQVTAGNYIILSISDTGCGMNEETKEKIFDPFFSTKGEKGTGLGLSQVYGFVERSGGAVKVYSEQGHGTRFSLYFPQAQLTQLESQQTTTEMESADYNETTEDELQGSETLLVVDDEKAMAELARDILIAHGYQVLMAHSGEQALAILDSECVDLLISDVIMPTMDGYQLAAQAQQRYAHIKIQMASGFTDERHNGIMDSSLSKNVLHKPYSANALLKCIRRLLDEG